MNTRSNGENLRSTPGQAEAIALYFFKNSTTGHWRYYLTQELAVEGVLHARNGGDNILERLLTDEAASKTVTADIQVVRIVRSLTCKCTLLNSMLFFLYTLKQKITRLYTALLAIHPPIRLIVLYVLKMTIFRQTVTFKVAFLKKVYQFDFEAG